MVMLTMGTGLLLVPMLRYYPFSGVLLIQAAINLGDA